MSNLHFRAQPIILPLVCGSLGACTSRKTFDELCVRTLMYLTEGYIYKGQAKLANSVMMTANLWFRMMPSADVDGDEVLKM
jgi:hypothetical protein